MPRPEVLAEDTHVGHGSAPSHPVTHTLQRRKSRLREGVKGARWSIPL